MEHYIIGMLPVPCIGNFPQCCYDVLDTIDNIFNLYFPSLRVASYTYMIFLCTPYFRPDKFATDINF